MIIPIQGKAMVQGEFLFSDADPKPAAPKEKAAKPFSVTQVTRLIKLTINDRLPAKILVEGEISNFKRHNSGHLYFTLKDENAQLPAVMWKSDAAQLKFKPADGLSVLATGRIDVFEPQGKYQFYVEKMEPAGLGSLELAFRQMAEKLRKEGLFDPQHKKPLPRFPLTIAIVTSPTGAAIEDIEKTLNRRFPIVRKLLYPVAVQGDTAAKEIAAAIVDLNRRSQALGGIDLMIVGRGGGSIEDLWAFNEEVVARAIFASTIPIISAVGHEVDVTIADMAADVRAATPTAAAELAVPVLAEVIQNLNLYQKRLYQNIRQKLEAAGNAIGSIGSRPLFARPLDLVRFKQQWLDEQTAALAQVTAEKLLQSGRTLELHGRIIAQIEPHRALSTASSRLSEHQHLLQNTLREFGRNRRYHIDNLGVKLNAASPKKAVEHQKTLLAHLAQRAVSGQRQKAYNSIQELNLYQSRLENLNPRSVLRRGYSITRRQADNRIVSGEMDIQPGELLRTELDRQRSIVSKVITNNKEQEAKS